MNAVDVIMDDFPADIQEAFENLFLVNAQTI